MIVIIVIVLSAEEQGAHAVQSPEQVMISVSLRKRQEAK